MNDVIALIDLYSGEGLGHLTKERPLAATTFLARYAFIDFALSNLTNSGIDNIGILVKDHPNSINKHIPNPNVYLTNPKTGVLTLCINEKGTINPVFNTDLNNIRENDYFFFDERVEYVILTDPTFVKKVDYKNIIEEHKKSGRLASLVYMHAEDGSEFPNAAKFVIDSLGDIQKQFYSTDSKEADISLNTLIINKSLLKELLELSKTISVAYSVHELLEYCVRFVSKIHAIKYDGYVRHFDSLKNYFKHSMELLNNQDLLNDLLNDSSWTYYTTTHNSRPVLYGPTAKVSSSLIANGAFIGGTVKNSIISRDVTIEEGAVVENCILFTHSVVKAGVHLKNVICDKRVTFKSKKEISGTTDNPLYFPLGVNV